MLQDLDSHSPLMRQAIAKCLWARQFKFDPDEAVEKYLEKGYDVPDLLAEFIRKYAEMRFIWLYGERTEVELTTDVERVLLTHRSWVTSAERKVGLKMWPVGELFETLESLLMDSSGVFYAYGDAGIQRISRGFDETVLALVGDTWDKSFL